MSGFRQALRVLLQLTTASEYSLQRSATWRLGCAEVEGRAGQLLVDNLTPSQREQYQTHGYFEVIGGDTGTRYRIHCGFQLNIEELDRKGQRLGLLCFMPQGRVPIGDVMLAQKVALELFESEAIRIAHWSPAWNDMLTAEVRFVYRNLRS